MHRWLAGHGLNVGSDHKFVPQAVFRASERSVRLFLQALFAGDGGRYTSGDSFYLQYYSNSRRLIEDLHHLLLRFGIFGLIREQEPAPGNLAYRIQIADKAQVLRFADRIGFVPGSIKQSRLEAQILPAIRARPRLKSNFDTLPREACAMVGTAARVGGLTLGQLNRFPQPVQSVPLDAVAKVTVATGDLHLPPLVAGSIWDVVETIEFAGVEDVYDICVPALQNFVANDLLVHNSTYARCGVIVNVTPLEPEWQGHVTLEFSNTTPLPAKIYANEGVAQMLFFESDEVCETSYADRGGKYQGQRGVTLPKA